MASHDYGTRHDVRFVSKVDIGLGSNSILARTFWRIGENIPVDTLIERIDTDRSRHNLSSAVRLFVLRI
jgi:predicted DNA-binding ribbon-helix-helix protein